MESNEQLKEDMEYVCCAEFIPWSALQGKSLFVTGATGLIGYTLVRSLLYANRRRHLNLKVIALVRDLARARERFGQESEDTSLEYVVGSVESLPEIEQRVDYIVHGASQTASRKFVTEPVETIRTSLRGTENILELARAKRVVGMVYLSSMEVYGHPERGHKVTEAEIGSLTPLDVRNSYPISKIQSESMCCSYASEYGLRAMVARLSQTFGPGAKYNDSRVFAEFARCVVEKRDIVLKTRGETERSYLYTADAATAILTILLKGSAGEAYNVTNERSYCSIAEMAERVARLGGIGVRYEIEEERKNGYPRAVYIDMDTSRLRSLGWEIFGGGNLPLIAMYKRLIEHYKQLR